ncbi:MAG TPA: crossover junction endodeoxyribonuclease RuvC [Saprospiraceae bacterium]|nr:crossover junction endodeoxyribonuclease RuvC [Saprospiraceae bacterium]
MTNKNKYRILGIDPGTNVLGYAVIELRKKEIFLVNMGIVKMSHLEGHQHKLKKIFDRVQDIIKKYEPQEMAIEAPFFGKNVQSMLKLGRAQGVAIAAGMTKNLEVTEYSPKKIKQSITGNGNASKEQVAAMLRTILKNNFKDNYLDATDALATAVCHHYQMGNKFSGKKRYSNWSSFLKDNPDKLKKKS